MTNIGLSLVGKLYGQQECAKLLSSLMNEIHWHSDYHVAFGRRFAIPRLQAWFADDGLQYHYENNLLRSQPWLHKLASIRRDVQQCTGMSFNSVLVTCYRNGHDHVTWHADDESELGPQPVIVSLSLGARRNFCFRRNSGDQEGSLFLEDGDLLIMAPEFQKHWQHCVPAEPGISEPRINLTFRNVIPAACS